MEGLFMQAPPILGGDRADATGADLLLQLRAEASGASSAADALGRLGGARRFARVADLLHTALDGSTTPESFANIVAARARASDELERGQDEREGLAAAGFGGTEDVSAGERVRDGRALDGGELLEVCVRESSLRRLREGHVLELAHPDEGGAEALLA